MASRTRSIFRLLTLGLFVALGTPASLAALASAPPEGLTESIDQILLAATRNVDKCGLLVIQSGSVIYDNGTNGLSGDTVFPIASGSKWLAGAVIMALVDQGLLTLDDRVVDYIDAFEEDLVTVRHLFSHTSGLPGDDAVCTAGMTLAECADEIAKQPILTMPGKVFHYGGLSMQIGGRIAEIVSGMSWHDVFAATIAEPLGMADTDFGAFGATTNPVIAGGARTTMYDYARFLEMLLGLGEFRGTRILSEEAAIEILTDQLVDTPDRPEIGYGIGCWGERIDPATNRFLVASSAGIFGFIPWVDVERDLIGIFAAYSEYSLVAPYYNQIRQLLEAAYPAT